MNPLLLSGWGVKIKVRNMRSHSDLQITDGRKGFDKPSETYTFRPRRIPYDSIIIDGHSGYISLQTFHWLSHNKVPVFLLGYDGSLISSILPPMPVKADLRVAQIDSYRDARKRFMIAHAIVEAKIQRGLDVLHWLGERYDLARKIREAKKEALQLPKAKTINDLRVVEARVAQKYWEAFQSVIPETFCFQSRLIRNRRPNNASDPVNLALNYGYGVLEGECRGAINIVGLEPSIGFLHESSESQTKQSLVYDLQEPYRWLVDVSVIEAFESGVLDLPDFYFTGDDYRYHIDVEAKCRFMKLLQEQFNTGAHCNGRVLKWDTLIEQKTNELGRFLTGKRLSFDFGELPMIVPQAKLLGTRRIAFDYVRRHSISSKPLSAHKPAVDLMIR
jgi:CRISPR-associated protein Cas1